MRINYITTWPRRRNKPRVFCWRFPRNYLRTSHNSQLQVGAHLTGGKGMGPHGSPVIASRQAHTGSDRLTGTWGLFHSAASLDASSGQQRGACLDRQWSVE